MRKTSPKDWKIPVSNSMYDAPYFVVYESNDERFAFYFSNIGEWGLLKYCSNLEIFKNKNSPEKIYDSGKFAFLFNPFNEVDFIFDWSNENLLCIRQLINKGNNQYSYPFTIINLEQLVYTYIPPEDFAECLKYETNRLQGLINPLQWKPLAELTSLK